MRIERVVEIEHPGLDLGETARCRTRGRHLNRTVVPLRPARARSARSRRSSDPLACSPSDRTARTCRRACKARCRRPRRAAARRLQRWPLGIDGLGEAVELAGWPLTSGRTHVPGATRYQPRVVTAPLSSMPIAAITVMRRLVAPGEASAVGLLRGGDQHVEEIASSRGGRSQFVVLQKLARALRRSSRRELPSIGLAS